MSLRTKIIALLIISIALAVGSITTGVWTSSLKASRATFYSTGSAQLDRVENLVDSFLAVGIRIAQSVTQLEPAQNALGTLTNYTQSTEVTPMNPQAFSPNEALLYEELARLQRVLPGAELVILGTEDGGYIKAPAGNIGKGYDPRKRVWYSELVNSKGAFNISAPYVSSTTKTLVTTVSAPIMNNNRLIGVVGVDFVLADLTEAVLSGVRVGTSGYLMLFDKQGRIMLNPHDAAHRMKKPEEVGLEDLNKLLGTESGVITLNLNGVQYLAVSHTLKNTGWKAAFIMKHDEVFQSSRELIVQIIIIGAAIALVLVLVGLYFAGSIIGPINQLVHQVGRVAQGDFAAIADSAKASSPEITALRTSLQSMVSQIHSLIESSAAKAKEADAQTTKARDALEEARKAREEGDKARREGIRQTVTKLEEIVHQIAVASQRLEHQVAEASRNAQGQRASMEESAHSITELSHSIQEASRNASDAAQSAQLSREQAKNGGELVLEVVSGIRSVDTVTEKLAQSLGGLGKQAEAIGSIMTVITDIADQTNLLALNAAIEAARAGEAGRGFAVVADEVRKLAEKTMQATREVGEAIKNIQQSTRDNLSAMSEATQRVNSTAATAEEAGRALTQIVDMATGTTQRISAIAAAGKEQVNAGAGINASVNTVSDLATHMARAMEESAEAVQALSALGKQLEDYLKSLVA